MNSNYNRITVEQGIKVLVEYRIKQLLSCNYSKVFLKQFRYKVQSTPTYEK